MSITSFLYYRIASRQFHAVLHARFCRPRYGSVSDPRGESVRQAHPKTNTFSRPGNSEGTKRACCSVYKRAEDPPAPPSLFTRGGDLQRYLVNNASVTVIRKNNQRYVCCNLGRERGPLKPGAQKKKRENHEGGLTTVTTRVELSRSF